MRLVWLSQYEGTFTICHRGSGNKERGCASTVRLIYEVCIKTCKMGDTEVGDCVARRIPWNQLTVSLFYGPRAQYVA